MPYHKVAGLPSQPRRGGELKRLTNRKAAADNWSRPLRSASAGRHAFCEIPPMTDAIATGCRKLENERLEGSLAEWGHVAGAGALRQGRSPGLPAGDAGRAFAERSAARQPRPRGRRTATQSFRRPYRRYLRGNAGGCRRQLRDRRPFRAPRRPRRKRCPGAAKSGSRLASRPHRHRLRRRNPGAARRRTRHWTCRRSAERLTAGGATATNLVVAYEPVWAIGTGLTPTEDVEQVHKFIRDTLTADLRRKGRDPHPLWRLGEAIQRRGTDGGPQCQRRLVGGASLKAADFLAIAAGVPN